MRAGSLCVWQWGPEEEVAGVVARDQRQGMESPAFAAGVNVGHRGTEFSMTPRSGPQHSGE